MFFDLEHDGNLIEGGFWAIFALVLVIGSQRRTPSFRRLGWLAATISLAFGLSDLVEARTGAWWRPWWLLVWKGLCVTGLVLCFLRYRMLSATPRGDDAIAPQAPSSSM
ncbi:MAG: hypothetical protein U0790_28735 [Isosphaeraceae bacterium]